MDTNNTETAKLSALMAAAVEAGYRELAKTYPEARTLGRDNPRGNNDIVHNTNDAVRLPDQGCAKGKKIAKK